MTLTLLNEWLEKQSPAMLEAKRRGLVPQSGDWEHPYRWVTPEEVEEIEAPESEEDSEVVERVKVYTGSDEPFTQFDESKIATRTDPGFAGRGAYTTTNPEKAARWGKYVMETTIPSDARLIPIRGISELYKNYGLKSLTFEELELSQEQMTRIYAKNINDFTDKMIDEGYDGVEWAMPTGDTQYVLFKPGKYEFAARGQESPSYEMPKYDLSWDALVETELKYIDMEINIRPIEDDWRSSDNILGRTIKDTDNFTLNLGHSWYFGESEEAVKEEVLKDYLTPKGMYFRSYNPPRLTPKPEWASDENDPFPEIPSDIQEIHYDDIPEFYIKDKYGEALQQFSSLKGISRKISEIAGVNSELFYEALNCVDGELDYEHAADIFSQDLGENVTTKQAKLALNRLKDMTQKSLEHRGLPEKFYVFRGGKIHDEDSPMPTSLSPSTAAVNYFSQKAGQAPYVAMYEVSRDDVLLDMNSMKSEGQGEEELVILGRNLKNPRMVRLPNKAIKNPDFHKSKSLDKSVTTESIAEAKRKGLVPQSGNWEKPRRWVTPEEVEEISQPKDSYINSGKGKKDFYANMKKLGLDRGYAEHQMTRWVWTANLQLIGALSELFGRSDEGLTRELEVGRKRYDLGKKDIREFFAYGNNRSKHFKPYFDLTQDILKEKYPDGYVTLYRGVGIGKQGFITSWTTKKGIAKQFGKVLEERIPINRIGISFEDLADVLDPPDTHNWFGYGEMIVVEETNDGSLEKAVTTESIAEAKKRGLVPQSGNWQKPRRWVRPEDADVSTVADTSDSSSDDYQKFLKFDHKMLVRLGALANIPGMSSRDKPKNKEDGEIREVLGITALNNVRDNVEDLRQERMGDLDHSKGKWFYHEWVGGLFVKIVGLRAIILENEGREISRDLVAQQMNAVTEEGEIDYKQVDFAIDFGKTMAATLSQETKEVSVQPTLDLLEAEHKFAVERTKELFGDEIEVFRCIYGDHVPELRKQLDETGRLEMEEFPLTSYTHDLDAAKYFCDKHMGRNYPSNKRMVFSRTIKAEEVMVSWYSNPELLSGFPEQKEVVISSKEGKFIINKDSIIG